MNEISFKHITTQSLRDDRAIMRKTILKLRMKGVKHLTELSDCKIKNLPQVAYEKQPSEEDVQEAKRAYREEENI